MKIYHSKVAKIHMSMYTFSLVNKEIKIKTNGLPFDIHQTDNNNQITILAKMWRNRNLICFVQIVNLYNQYRK